MWNLLAAEHFLSPWAGFELGKIISACFYEIYPGTKSENLNSQQTLNCGYSRGKIKIFIIILLVAGASFSAQAQDSNSSENIQFISGGDSSFEIDRAKYIKFKIKQAATMGFIKVSPASEKYDAYANCVMIVDAAALAAYPNDVVAASNKFRADMANSCCRIIGYSVFGPGFGPLPGSI